MQKLNKVPSFKQQKLKLILKLCRYLKQNLLREYVFKYYLFFLAFKDQFLIKLLTKLTERFNFFLSCYNFINYYYYYYHYYY